MIQIKTNGESLDLPAMFSIEMENTNPIYNERGSQSTPVTLPTTRRNIRLLDAPHRIDAGINPNNPERMAQIVNGASIRRGMINVTDASKTEGITFNIGFDNSILYMKWIDRKLCNLENLPDILPPGHNTPSVDGLLNYIDRIYRTADSQIDEFAVFPLAVNKEDIGTKPNIKTYWEVLNIPGTSDFKQPKFVKRVIDGTVTDVAVPDGYCVSPFLRVWRLLELVFENIGLILVSNPFRYDRELSRLVVLNNTADAICRGRLRYSDIVPDVTVGQFLNALWVRFGLVYNVDFDKGLVKLALLNDVISRPATTEYSNIMASQPKITYETPQYIKLSAKTSIEGAEPANERFEDFVKGLDLSDIKTALADNGTWSRPGDFDDVHPGDHYLGRVHISGNWYRVDALSGKTAKKSSGFFNWDTQTPGFSPLELQSDDEFVPMLDVYTVGMGTGNTLNDICPAYLCGARHYHSSIIGNDNDTNDNNDTPLSFMMAFTKNNATFGRIVPVSATGERLILDDGTTPTLSLLFQFKDGLFARFWAKYDEILRHGNRVVEIDVNFDKKDITDVDMFSPVSINGIKFLIDSFRYTLPAQQHVSSKIKLRNIITFGHYDIDAEQNIPGFGA